jgi:glutathione synthase/RimK-type ligase-like ATP-grasp enzyme
MQILLVVNNPKYWPLTVQGVDVVSARQYLTDTSYGAQRNARVFNLCRSYSYQSLGYYVSLLAEARGHKPQPDIVTIQDMKSTTLTRVLTEELDDLIQSTLRPIRSDRFEMSIYFGRTTAKRDQRLGSKLFSLFRAPLLRAQFVKKDRWQWQSIRPIATKELPEHHREHAVEAANAYFARRDWSSRRPRPTRYDMAILHDPQERRPPSDPKALERFIRSAKRNSIAAELVTRDDLDHLGEYDALFIRTTTAVNHYTFRAARRAEADGLAVIDGSHSIARCANKVYLAERLGARKIPTPRTEIIHRDNTGAVLDRLGLPIVLKQPDSSFSIGVVKATDGQQYEAQVEQLLEESDLIVAQTFMPTDFDWRVGVLDGKPLYVCKYYMASKHWQIMQHGGGHTRYGKVETFAVEDAPRRVVNTAVRACRLIGDGLYGVDLKQTNGKVYVIEVNDNPNIDAGYEDKVLKSELYDRIMQWFVRRIETLREQAAKGGGR